MDDKRQYLRWLEEMWNTQKHDIHAVTEREEQRKKEILEVFEDLGEVAKCSTKAPEPLWRTSGGRGENHLDQF